MKVYELKNNRPFIPDYKRPDKHSDGEEFKKIFDAEVERLKCGASTKQ